LAKEGQVAQSEIPARRGGRDPASAIAAALPRNFVVIDCETSGLDPKRHALLSIGAVTASGREFYRECLFDESCEIDPEAMAVNQINLGLQNAEEDAWPAMAVLELVDWLREEHGGRWVMGGKNPQFDYAFLLEAAGIGVADEWRGCVSRRCVDLHAWAYGWAMAAGLDVAAADTESIYGALGYAPEPRPHQALQGARLEMAIFRDLMARGIFREVKR
jgi:hypothetical protein